MIAVLQPSTMEELAEAVRSSPRVLPVGGGTKPRLSAAPGAVPLSLAGLGRILEYDPSEFTFTAEGGTPLRDIGAALAERGQHLPFDLALAGAGATLGGTVAAGLSGSGRLRFGGLRDFILAVRFVDGAGRVLRMGGKVVKNAAGFDLPKFFVGSLGRFGVLGELTFKVFPRPQSELTIEFTVPDAAAMAQLFAAAARGRWEFAALDASLPGGRVYGRLGGAPEALAALAADLAARWPARVLPAEAAAEVWRSANELGWAHPGGVLFKLPLTLARLPDFTALLGSLSDARGWVSGAGNGGCLSLADAAQVPALERALRPWGGTALALRGESPLWLGRPPDAAIFAAVKRALDPADRFPPLS
jgi:glycolate oxidase FAD binding subunit